MCARRGPEDLVSDDDYGYRRLLWEDGLEGGGDSSKGHENGKVPSAQESVGGLAREHGDGVRGGSAAMSGASSKDAQRKERWRKGRRRGIQDAR